MANSPLADLTYRGYEGGLSPQKSRWRVIARHTARKAFKNKWFWWLTILSGVHYLILAAVTYFLENMSEEMGSGQFPDQFFSSLVWRDQFLHGFALGHLMLMAIVLIVGAGSIANDNQSRALLVYLSKPCSKWDYLAGKWMGVFTPLVVAMGIPTTFFYFYAVMNFRERGFLAEDPWLVLKLPVVLALAAAFQASLIVGFSAIFKQGRVAGATYAGAYVLTGLFATLTGGIAQNSGLADSVQTLLSRLHYVSIYGVIEGIYKVVLNTDGTRTFGGDSTETVFAKPPVFLLILLFVVPAGLALWVAWRRIRAVEVVG